MHTPDTVTAVPGRIHSLTGLRWIAALAVFVYHAVSMPYMFPVPVIPQSWTYWLTAAGEWGPSFFFVLSGFVLAWAARPTDTARRFWRRRFFKIYPVHWVAWALAMGVMLWTGITVEKHHEVESFLLVQTWIPSMWAALGVNPVAWSLSVEAFFYLCFPLLFLLVRRVRTERLWLWISGLTAAVFLVPVVASLLPATPVVPWMPTLSDPQLWFTRFFPVPRLLEFAIGILLARAVLAGRIIPIRRSWAWAAVAIGYVLSTVTQGQLIALVALNLVPIILLVMAYASADIAGRSGLMATRPMVYLGNLSFCFYLVHRIALEYMSLVFGPDFQWTTSWAVVLIAIAGAVAMVVSWAMHEFIEKPVYRRFAESGRAHRREPAPVSVG